MRSQCSRPPFIGTTRGCTAPTHIYTYSSVTHGRHCRNTPADTSSCSQHSNGIAVLGLACGHPARQTPVTACNFADNVSALVTSGKRKRGGQATAPGQTRICQLTCADGRSFDVVAPFQGSIIEINARVADNPALLSDRVRVHRVSGTRSA